MSTPSDHRAAPACSAAQIVLATNIAETSITIDDCGFVIDSGCARRPSRTQPGSSPPAKHLAQSPLLAAILGTRGVHRSPPSLPRRLRRMKETRFDPTRRMESLEDCFVSRSNARQRRGRAGRVKSGVAFHLVSRHRFERVLPADQLPEIKRVPLEQLILRIKALKYGEAAKVCAKCIDPPEPAAVERAIRELVRIDALTVTGGPGTGRDVGEELTPLGQHLATLPVDVRIGKLILLVRERQLLGPGSLASPGVSPSASPPLVPRSAVPFWRDELASAARARSACAKQPRALRRSACCAQGAIFGCVDDVLTIAATLSFRSPFLSPLDRRVEADEAKRSFCAGQSAQSDHLAALNAYNEFNFGGPGRFDMCREKFLGVKTLIAIGGLKRQLLELLSDAKFVRSGLRAKAVEAVGRRLDNGADGVRVALREGVGEAGACFRCGQAGHSARECPLLSLEAGSAADADAGPEPAAALRAAAGPYSRDQLNGPLLKALLCAALYPQARPAARRAPGARRAAPHGAPSAPLLHPTPIRRPP